MKKIIYLLSILTILFIGMFSSSVAYANDDLEYIVLFKDVANASVSSQNRVNSSIVESLNGKVVRDLDNIPAMTVLMSESEMQELKAQKEVAAVEENVQVKLSTQSLDWGIGTVKAQKAWSSGYTGDGVKVAVLDSGIKTHSDLIIKGGVDLVPNTIDGVTSYSDTFGHGTFVAGIISGLNNTIGFVGVAPDADLYAVKVFYNGITDLDLILSGIDWCIDNNMDIVNMSFGSPNDSPTYKAMIQSAYANGLILVAATGNDDNGLHNTDTVNYPAKYDEVIGVGATDESNEIASFSSSGSGVEVSGPGVEVVSTNIANSYSIGSGTSFATPYTAGVLALYKEKHPTATNVEIRQMLIDNTIDLGVIGKDDLYGYGIVQAPPENITYRSYINYKWLPWTGDGSIAGEEGRMMSAFQMDLISNGTDDNI
ncbi:MAG: S8 family peptidase, partial [Firmicutes bacterium]|nr:S8 family peptidase [Bacillota bacterium]